MVDARLTADGLVALFMALGQFSLLYKDNPWYRLSMHIYFGCYMGYQTVVMIFNIIRTGWTPLIGGKDYTLIIPLILGIIAFTKFSKTQYYWSRYPVSFLIGLTTGTMMVGWLDAMIMKQIASTITIFTGLQTPVAVVSTLVFVVSFITSLLFFIFSLPLTRPKPMVYTMKIGRYFLMLMLGCYYASIVQMRISTMLTPMQFFLLGVRGG